MDKFQQIIEDYTKIVELYNKETDRVAAVLASSFLEKELGDCIKSFLIDDPSVEELFKGYGPFASLSARIDMAFALGLIHQKMKDDLNYIRKIRNHFAHHPAETSFEVSPVRDLCSNLWMLKQFSGEAINPLENTPRRIVYLLTVSAIIFTIHSITSTQERRKPPAIAWPK